MQSLKKSLASLFVALLVGAFGLAQAGSTAPVPFNVSITIASTCAVSTPPDLAVIFDRDATVPTEASSPFTVTCTNGTAYSYDLDSSGMAARTNLVAPNTNLLYNLDVTNPAGAPVTGGTGNDLAQAANIHVYIPNGQPSGTAGTDVIPHTIAVTF